MAKPKFNTDPCLIPKLMFSPLFFAKNYPDNSGGWNAGEEGREPSDKTTVMMLLRDAKNLDQDSDRGNAETDMDFIGSRREHYTTGDSVELWETTMISGTNEWMDVSSQRALFSMTFEECNREPVRRCPLL